jgi:hypothetical protein
MWVDPLTAPITEPLVGESSSGLQKEQADTISLPEQTEVREELVVGVMVVEVSSAHPLTRHTFDSGPQESRVEPVMPTPRAPVLRSTSGMQVTESERPPENIEMATMLYGLADATDRKDVRAYNVRRCLGLDDRPALLLLTKRSISILDGIRKLSSSHTIDEGVEIVKGLGDIIFDVKVLGEDGSSDEQPDIVRCANSLLSIHHECIHTLQCSLEEELLRTITAYTFRD